jgi:hypothetical protein
MSTRQALLVSMSLAGLLIANTSDGSSAFFTPAHRKHWSMQKVKRPELPKAGTSELVRTPVDAFILARLETRGLSLSADADRITLLRRVSIDLIGLPPTPQEVEAFVADQSPDAYEKVVDRLLASPHYGERWARHWLDLARDAESEGLRRTRHGRMHGGTATT